jgi:hypothetical protein
MRLRRNAGLWFPLLAAGALCVGGTGLAQSLAEGDSAATASGAQVGFHYENQQLQPAKYSFVIYENGSGQFHSEPADTPLANTASYEPLARADDRSIQLSRPAVDQIFSAARTQKFFAIPCEAKDKVAFQGTKKLSYQGPDGSGSCTYNWSKVAAIQKVTYTFESIALTLEEGRRLAVEHKHDRLALDAELGFLLEAVKDGRASEIQTIRPVLQEIAGDEAVLDRARSRAKKLLGDGNSTASLR